MTESIKTAIKAINKWVFFGWNYQCIQHEWVAANGDWRTGAVPQFLAEVRWTCNFDHMYQKWCTAINDTDTNSYLVTFYAELDDRNVSCCWNGLWNITMVRRRYSMRTPMNVLKRKS